MSNRKRKPAPAKAEQPVEDDYRLKRQRNNEAVNRTREKKRKEESDTFARVEQLKEENIVLERKVESLQSELALLKEMFMNFANKKKGGDGGGQGSGPGPSAAT